MKREVGTPILMRDGKIIEQVVTMVNSEAIEKEMRYISKMAIALSTGLFADDIEYIEVRDRVIEELVKERSKKAKIKIDEEIDGFSGLYEQALSLNNTIKDRMQKQAEETAEENAKAFVVLARGNRPDAELIKIDVMKGLLEENADIVKEEEQKLKKIKLTKDILQETMTLTQRNKIAEEVIQENNDKSSIGRGVPQEDIKTYQETYIPRKKRKITKKKTTKKKTTKQRRKKNDRK